MQQKLVTDPVYEELRTKPLFDLSKRKKTFSSPQLHALQRRHFLLFDLTPGVLTVAAVALAATQLLPFGWIEVTLFTLFWLMTGLGISVGYHRLFTHRAFKAAPALRRALVVAGSMAGQGAPISWSALHRRHHEFSDCEGDPHSPNLHGHTPLRRLRGFIHSHFTWMMEHEFPSVTHYTPDLLRDPVVARLESRYGSFLVLGLVTPAILGGALHGSWQGAVSGLLWGGFVRMFVLGNTIWMINSVLHTVGPRAYATADQSRNSALLALFSFGESWHNNHHAFPASASFGLAWYRLDPGFWCIRLFTYAGLAEAVHVPSPGALRNRLGTGNDTDSAPASKKGGTHDDRQY